MLGESKMRFAILAGAIILAGSASAADLELPLHKAGLWQNGIDADGQHITNMQCFDDVSQKKLVALSHARCSEHHVTHNADGSWTSTGTCEFQQGTVVTSSSAISGDFDRRLTVVTDTTAPSVSHVAVTSTWIGVCKPGMSGGDVVMSDGSKINMLDEMGGK
jgi:hypothetical protein